jgi:S-formylglutathione hydrolase FrmB
LEIALRHQDIFGIVGAHSPALSLNRPLPQYDPFLLVKEDISGLRFYLDAGNTDWARVSTVKLRDTLIELGADVMYHEHIGAHVDGLWQMGLEDYVDYYALKWPRSFEELPLSGSGL